MHHHRLFTRFAVAHPAVPPALEGLRLWHLTDLHVRARRPGSAEPLVTAALRRVLDGAPTIGVDLVCLTGDIAHHAGDEAAAATYVRELASRWTSRFGAVGVFGNHDPAELGGLLHDLPGVRWLGNERTLVDIGGVGLPVVGSSEPEDLVAAVAMGEPAGPAVGGHGFVLGLSHYPTQVYPASRLGVSVLLAGHTHGGQVRLSKRRSLHTSCDLPGTLACGVLRLGQTLCCVSRGLGESAARIRINCPPQAPVYELRRGQMWREGSTGERLEKLLAW